MEKPTLTSQLFENFRDAVSGENVSNTDMALYLLLKLYAVEDFPEFDNFHKGFRQYDIHKVPGIDSAVWYLLRESNLFWTVYGSLMKDGS